MSLCPQTGQRLCLHLPGGAVGPAPGGLGLHGSLFPGQPLLPAHPFPSGGTTTRGPQAHHQGPLPRVCSEVSLRCNPAWALEQMLTQAQGLPSPSAQGRWCPSSPGAEPHVVGTTRALLACLCSRICFRGMCFRGITLPQTLEPEAGLETRCAQRAVLGPSPAVPTSPSQLTLHYSFMSMFI